MVTIRGYLEEITNLEVIKVIESNSNTESIYRKYRENTDERLALPFLCYHRGAMRK